MWPLHVKKHTINSDWKMSGTFPETCLDNIFNLNECLFVIKLPETDTSLGRTTDTLKLSTDTCEVVFLLKNTSKRNVAAENDSKLIMNYVRKIFTG